jgi:hypothetical protein
METSPFDAIAEHRFAMFDCAQFCPTISRPMSKKTATELEILSTTYANNPNTENAAQLIKTLQEALKAREDSVAELEKGIRMLELFLAEKTDCARKKP